MGSHHYCRPDTHINPITWTFIDPDWDELEIDPTDYTEHNRKLRMRRAAVFIKQLNKDIWVGRTRFDSVVHRFDRLIMHLHMQRRARDRQLRQEFLQQQATRRQLIELWAQELLCE